MKRSFKILSCLVALLGAASCIYDYDPQIDGEGGYLIVEGDIVVGDVFQIGLDYSWSLVDTLTSQYEERYNILSKSNMRVEASDGTSYGDNHSVWGGLGRAWFDLTGADPSLEYRLVIDSPNGTYASDWASPLSGGSIDSLSYKISDDKKTMGIRVSAHSSEGQGYYRWSVKETWEYNADVYAIVEFSPTEGMKPMTGYNLYHCWNSANSSNIMTASTVELVEDRLVDHHLYDIDYHDERISVMYCAEVRQMRIPDEAYRYYQVMDKNSGDVGGLFSPEPSEFHGNVHNIDSPDELVLGYVGVMSVTSKKLYVDNSMTRFYRRQSSLLPSPDTLTNYDQYLRAYSRGRLPATDILDDFGNVVGYEWWPARCVDCRYKGGSKNKPEGWPNNDE